MPSRQPRLPAVEPPPPPMIENETPPLPAENAADPKDKLDFFQYLRTLDPGFLSNCVIYWYRLEPKIKNKDSDLAYILKSSAEGVDEDFIKQKFGGGKYQGWLRSPDPAKDVKRKFYIDGPAIIYPDQILVDAKGEPLPTPAANPQPALPPAVNEEVIAKIVRMAFDAAKENKGSADTALNEAMTIFRKAQEGGMEILTASLKQQVGNGGNSNEALLRAIEDLGRRLEPRKDNSGVDQIIEAGIQRILNPPAPPSFVDSIKQLAGLSELEGLGFLKNIFGGNKEESFWESAGKMLFDSLATVIKDNGPAIIEAYREGVRRDFVLAQMRMGQQRSGEVINVPPGGQPGVPAPAPRPQPQPQLADLPIPSGGAPTPPAYPGAPSAKPAQSPSAGPAAPPNPGAGQPNPSEEQMFQMLVQQITRVIRNCWDAEDDGHDTAITVKRTFRELVPMLRTQFKDVNQVLGLARQDANLGPIAGEPEFQEFAQQFLTEFMRDDGPAGAPPPGQA